VGSGGGDTPGAVVRARRATLFLRSLAVVGQLEIPVDAEALVRDVERRFVVGEGRFVCVPVSRSTMAGAVGST